MKPLVEFVTAANYTAAERCQHRRWSHMAAGDVAVWREVLNLGLMPADSYEYDVKLGGSDACLVQDEHELKPMWATLLCKRVDVVCWRGDVPWLCEVKPVASFSALGQCIGYRWLWDKQRGNGARCRAAVACAKVDGDLMPIFAAYGVSVVLLPLASAASVLALLAESRQVRAMQSRSRMPPSSE